jgi:hypothetical protein
MEKTAKAVAPIIDKIIDEFLIIAFSQFLLDLFARALIFMHGIANNFELKAEIGPHVNKLYRIRVCQRPVGLPRPRRVPCFFWQERRVVWMVHSASEGVGGEPCCIEELFALAATLREDDRASVPLEKRLDHVLANDGLPPFGARRPPSGPRK